MIRQLLLLIGYGLINPTLAQVAIPSSSALQSIRSANAQGLYTGQADISIPLYQLPGRQKTLPVGLRCNARGVKVDEIAGPFGLGWSLQAGGMISRVVRGVPDEDATGMCYRTNHQIASSSNQDIADGLVDGEPDIFYYNYLGGSGQFYIEDGAAYTLPYRDIKIDLGDFCKIDDVRTITITDERGFNYVYNWQETSRTNIITQIPDVTPDETITGDPKTSTWHLGEITNANGQREFTFSYFIGRSNLYKESNTIYELYNVLSDPQHCNNSSHKLITKEIETFNSLLLLGSIESDYGVVELNYAFDREDSEDRRIDHITVKDQNDVEVLLYQFEMDYWKFDTAYGTFHGVDADENQICLEEKCKRLYLHRILQIADTRAIVHRELQYYDGASIPPRGSRYQDHWGYPNYNPSLDLSWAEIGYTPKIKVGSRFFGRVDKDPTADLGIAQAGLIKSMIQPTGGTVGYEYEKTTGQPIASSPIGFESWYDYFDSPYGPGVRIKRTTVSAGDQYTNDIVTTYDYEGGRFYKPYYAWKINEGPIELNGHALFDCQFEVYLVISSQSQKAMYDLGGTGIGYSKVTETRSDGARTMFQYTNQEYEDVAPRVDRYVAQTVGSPMTIEVSPEGPPFTYYNSQSWKRGLLKRMESYNASNELVARTINTYNLSQADKHATHAKTVEREVGQNFLVANYDLVSQPINIARVETLLPDQDLLGNLMSQTTTYIHEDQYNYLREKSMIASDGMVHKTTYTYPFDYTTDAQNGNPEAKAIHALKTRHVHSLPLEIVKYRGAKVQNAVFNSHKIRGDNVNPYRTYALQNTELLDVSSALEDYTIAHISSPGLDLVIDERFRWTSENLRYDDNTGNLLLSHTYNGLFIESEFDETYEGNYLTRQLAYQESSVSACIAGGAIDATCVLNTTKPDARVTSYTHKPLVGTLSETDINGRRTFYEYDIFNRLQLIRDHEGNISQKYEYKLIHESDIQP